MEGQNVQDQRLTMGRTTKEPGRAAMTGEVPGEEATAPVLTARLESGPRCAAVTSAACNAR